MSKNLYCPKCKVEYWGDTEGAKCTACGHIFKNWEFNVCTGHEVGGNVEYDFPNYMEGAKNE